MAKQLYTGPPTEMLPLYMEGDGWRYSPARVEELTAHPYYTFWLWCDTVVYARKRVSLWWNGARWVVWIQEVLVAEPTDFTDINDPPIEWAEGVFRLTNT
jgi:hypothetical protein